MHCSLPPLLDRPLFSRLFNASSSRWPRLMTVHVCVRVHANLPRIEAIKLLNRRRSQQRGSQHTSSTVVSPYGQISEQ